MPFEYMRKNVIEIINELVILLAVFHMFSFSDFYDNYEMKYQIGWSLNILVCLQIIINILIMSVDYFYGMAMKIRRIANRLKIKAFKQERQKIVKELKAFHGRNETNITINSDFTRNNDTVMD